MTILEKINSPADLKRLSSGESVQLAAEIRGQIIKTISKNGGHLASSLGAVELTIALHRVFNSPQDKIIWDVGHQSYAHKLLNRTPRAFRDDSPVRRSIGLPQPGGKSPRCLCFRPCGQFHFCRIGNGTGPRS